MTEASRGGILDEPIDNNIQAVGHVPWLAAQS
jgi:hypothetical protein